MEPGAPEDTAPGELLLELNPRVELPDERIATLFGDAVPEALAEGYTIRGAEAAEMGVKGKAPDLESEALAESLALRARSAFKTEGAKLRQDVLDRQDKLTQIITFSSNGREVSLYNFTASRLDAEQTGKLANTLSAGIARTGTAVFDYLQALAILPNDDPLVAPRNEDGEIEGIAAGDAFDGVIYYGEHLFNPDTPLPEVTAPNQDLIDHLEHAGEDVPYDVEGDPIQVTTFHELTHIVAIGGGAERQYAQTAGWEYADDPDTGYPVPVKRGHTDHPMVYGRVSGGEDSAVTASADFVGGEQKAMLDDDRRLALHGLWHDVHAGLAVSTIVEAAEQPLPVPPAKVGELPSEPLVLVPDYSYVSKTADIMGAPYFGFDDDL